MMKRLYTLLGNLFGLSGLHKYEGTMVPQTSRTSKGSSPLGSRTTFWNLCQFLGTGKSQNTREFHCSKIFDITFSLGNSLVAKLLRDERNLHCTVQEVPPIHGDLCNRGKCWVKDWLICFVLCNTKCEDQYHWRWMFVLFIVSIPDEFVIMSSCASDYMWT